MQQDFRHLAAKLKHLSPGELADVRRAYDFAVRVHADQKREDGSPYVNHVIAVAEIVAGWQADRDTVIAALLHDVLEDTLVKRTELLERFGRHVTMLVEGITKFTQADLSPDLPLDRKIETVRKLFDVMRFDIRSIIIKLADRLHNIQTIQFLPTPERRRRFALETLNVYYKIAFHLGMREVRRFFAEHCVPHAYEEGRDEQKQRDLLCDKARQLPDTLEKELKSRHETDRILDIHFIPRNLLIFHEKVQERGAALLQDACAISIVVRTEEDCYQLLKTIHTLYRPVSGQFRDYIAAPSDAGYRSLHTHVALDDGSVIEIRIRTPEMLEQAMRGVTLSLFGEQEPTQLFSWLKRSEILDLKTRDSSSAFWEALESDVLREVIAVTVDRKRISLPKGSTLLDAAYAAYDARAGYVKLCTLNGRSMPGSEALHEDDEIHMMFDDEKQVTFEWLQMVSTRHARLLIIDVLKQTDKSEKIALGATLLQKELDRYNKGVLSELSRSQCHHVAEHFRRATFDQVLSMIGEGVVRARDVVFYLYPDRHRRGLFSRKPAGRPYTFRLFIVAPRQAGRDVLSQVNGLIRMSDVSAEDVHIRSHAQKEREVVEIHVSGTCTDRLQFADFIELLERQEWISSVQTLIPRRQKFTLLLALAFAFILILADIVVFPAYQSIAGRFSVFPEFVIQALPLLPILAVNYYLLQLLRHYVVRMRSDRWFLVVAFLLNVIGLMVLVLRIVFLHSVTASLLPLLAIFVLSLVYMGYKFFQTDALFAPFDRHTLRPMSEKQWRKVKARKMVGYVIRFGAVLIWGLEPIYIRYTVVNDLSPFLRTFLLGFGVVIPSAVIYGIRHLITQKRIPSIHIPYNGAFLALVIGQVGLMYFKNASLVYTSGTNLLLFNNFSPLLGLLIAAFFWRKEIPYLKEPRHMLIVFLLGVLGGIGSSLLVYDSAIAGTPLSILGDALAMISMFFDLLLVVGQIQYIKQFQKTDGMLLNLHIFFFLLLCTAPVIVLAPLFGISLLQNLTPQALLLGLGIGLFVGFGQLLNYESFKRIDGYLAYMMFNLSVLITFVFEAFFVHSIQPTFLLVLSGLLIIGASVFAEIVNSRCQRKGL